MYFIEQLKHSLWLIKYTWPEKCALQHLKYTFLFDLAHTKFNNKLLYTLEWFLQLMHVLLYVRSIWRHQHNKFGLAKVTELQICSIKRFA